jgi:hypothetical protein
MEKIDYTDPHPNWTEVIILWKEIIEEPFYPIKQILDWIDVAPGGRYHLHGYNCTEGFSFRFENPLDATYFRLMWV